MLFYWKDRALRWWLLAGCGAIFALVFALYGLPVQAVGYAALLCAALLAGYGVLGSLHYRAKHQKLQQAQHSIGVTLDGLPPADSQLEQDYQRLLGVLSAEKASAVLAADEAQSELVDYFTLWAHQIKTPIAAMSLLLQGDRPPDAAEISEQLFQIEEYVGMVLSYLRLGSEGNDFVLRSYDLDGILRQAVRKYARLFIRKKLALVYEPVGRTVLTDEKWLLFVVEQLLSNAIKYTPKGSVSLLVEGDDLELVIALGLVLLSSFYARIPFSNCIDNRYRGLSPAVDRCIYYLVGKICISNLFNGIGIIRIIRIPIIESTSFILHRLLTFL